MGTTDPTPGHEPHITLDVPVSVARAYLSANLTLHGEAARTIEAQLDAALLVHDANERGVDDLLATLQQLVDARRAERIAAEVVAHDDAFAWADDVHVGGAR